MSVGPNPNYNVLGLENKALRSTARFRGVPGATIAVVLSTSTAAIPGLAAGLHYMCCSDVDCWINAVGAAVKNGNFYLPAKTPMLLIFAADGGDASAAQAIAGGAGNLAVTLMTEA